MNMLLVTSTHLEVERLLAKLGIQSDGKLIHYKGENLEMNILISGVGLMQTAFHTGITLEKKTYDFALNIGIAGSFNDELSNGGVVEVISEQLADHGAQDEDQFIDLFELGLVDPNEFPFSEGILKNERLVGSNVLNSLEKVSGVSSDIVHGDDAAIQNILKKHHPDVATMEGAAFFYACLQKGINFAAIRAISNKAEKRNRSNWEIDLALDKLTSVVFDLIKELGKSP